MPCGAATGTVRRRAALRVMAVLDRSEHGVQRRLDLGGKRRIGIAQLVRIAGEVVVLLLPVGVLDVKPGRGSKRFIGGRISAADTREVRVDHIADRPMVLDQRDAAPIRTGSRRPDPPGTRRPLVPVYLRAGPLVAGARRGRVPRYCLPGRVAGQVAQARGVLTSVDELGTFIYAAS